MSFFVTTIRRIIVLKVEKKGKKVSLRISVRWPAEAAGVSVKVRDANTP